MTKEERKLLKKLNSGELDGVVGRDLVTSGGSTVRTAIKNGQPMRTKEGPGGRFFNGKENERYDGKKKTLEKWDTDEKKLGFLQKLGFLIQDDEVQAYSAKFKKE